MRSSPPPPADTIITIPATTPTEPESKESKNLPNLYYLRSFNQQEKNGLVNQYKKNLVELENQLIQYRKSYLWYSTKYAAYNLCNVAYVYFKFSTSRDGLTSIFSAPALFNSIVAGTVSALDFTLNITSYSPWKEAAKATLAYANPEPPIQRTNKQTMAHLLQFATNQLITNTYNITLSISVASEIYAGMSNYGNFIQKGGAALLMGCSTGWFMKVFNPSYYAGLDFWKNKEHPWLFGEIKRGNFAIPYEIFLQGIICSILPTLVTSITYLTKTANEEFGFWPPNYLIIPLCALELLCSTYPSTYNHYMLNNEKIIKHLSAYLENTAGSLIQQQADLLITTGLSAEQLLQRKVELKKQIMTTLIKTYRQAIQTKLIEEQGHACWLKKEPAVSVILAYLMGIGAYVGSTWLGSLCMQHIVDEPVSMTTLGTLIGIGLATTLPLLAERHWILDGMVDEIIEERLKTQNSVIESKEEAKPVAIKPLSRGEIWAPRLANIAVVGSGLSSALSTIGMGKKLFGSDALYMTLTAMVSGQQMLNKMFFYGPKVRNTWTSALSPDSSPENIRVSNVAATLYSKPTVAQPPRPEAEPESPRRSWFCCRSRRRS